ncbi:hypothetical protein Tco_0674297, partial [Tanacetum coccineum]
KNTSIGARDARFGRGKRAKEETQGQLRRNLPAGVTFYGFMLDLWESISYRMKKLSGRGNRRKERDETYNLKNHLLDFDDEDEGEEQNEEFTLHSTNTMEYSTFGSYKDEEDEDNDNNSFEDLISIHQLKEHDQTKVGEDDSVFENKKEQEKVSLVKDEHHVVERCHENSLSKLTHIIVKQIHRKARVGVRKQKLSLCHGKREFQEVLNSGKLLIFGKQEPREKHVRIQSIRRKRNKE